MTRREVYFDERDGAWGFRGSSFGNCQHGLVLSMNGGTTKPIPDWLKRRLRIGSLSESALKRDMLLCHLHGDPKDGSASIGKLYDGEDNYRDQRQVVSYYMRSLTRTGLVLHHMWVDTCKTLHTQGVIAQSSMPLLYKITCSLDGWGLDARRFVYNLQDFYDDLVDYRVVPDEFGPFVLEHKSINKEKHEYLDLCCDTVERVINPDLFARYFPVYSWQISAQMYGVQTMMREIFLNDIRLSRCPLRTTAPRAFVSVDILDSQYESTGRQLYYLPTPPRTGVAIAERLAQTIEWGLNRQVPACDSEFECMWQSQEEEIAEAARVKDARKLSRTFY